MRRLAVAAVLAAVALLAGCSTIPVSGPVNIPASQNAAPPGVPVLTPAGPSPGASPADVVRGFLYAGSGQQDDYGIARQYLTPAFATRWRPGTGVLVYQSSPVVSAGDGSGVTASVTPVASLDGDGYLTQPASPVAEPLRFTVAKVDGEWRIASAPDGVVLLLSVFQRLFRTVALDYFTPAYDELVPDLRWFPASGDATSDPVRRVLTAEVVRRLLAGAAPPLAAPVTATGFPSGSSVRSVQVSGTTAVVDLHVAGAPAAATIARMHQQLSSSLNAIGVGRVELELDGVAPASQADSPLSPPASAVDGPLVQRGDAFGYVTGGQFAADAVLGAAVVKADPKPVAKAVTASKGLQRAAVLTGSGSVELVAPKTKPTVLDTRAGLIGPALDPDGWVWTVPSGDPLGLVATRDGQRQAVPITVDAGSVTAIEASRDGTRLLMVLSGATDPRVVVAGIQRDAQGRPVGLTDDLYEAPLAATAVVDATWADGGTVAVIVRRSDGTEGVVLQQLGGLSVTDGVLSQASAIVGGAAQADLTVLAGRDVQQTGQGNTIWQTVATGADLLAVQR